MNVFTDANGATRALALAALILGALALIGGDPYRGGSAVVDTRDLSLEVNNEVDHVSPPELAGMIIEGRNDFRLIDLRSPSDYAAYHIPGAENVTMAALADYPLARNEKIILYSDGGVHSAQAWFLLRAKEFRGVYILRGGLEEWKDAVLFPRLPDGASAEERAAFERRKMVSAFFGGTPGVGGPSASSPALALPKLPQQGAASAPAAAGAKKKKEGC